MYNNFVALQKCNHPVKPNSSLQVGAGISGFPPPSQAIPTLNLRQINMAGSNKWFVYTTDDGTDYAIQLDESNTEAVNGATQDYVAGVAFKYSVPKNLRPRTAYYASPDGNRKIRCVALTQTIYNGIPANVTSINDPITPTATLNLVRIRPEVISPLPFANDTGLTDGDAT